MRSGISGPSVQCSRAQGSSFGIEGFTLPNGLGRIQPRLVGVRSGAFFSFLFAIAATAARTECRLECAHVPGVKGTGRLEVVGYWFWIWGFGLIAQVTWYTTQGLGFGVWGLGFRN